jgi:hypothetical protein
MSSQVNANIIFSMNAFNDYDNKSALLLRFRHAIAEEGTLIIIQETNDVNEYAKYESILEKTHGLKQVYRNDISNDVVSAVEKIANKSETLSPRYAHFNEYVNNNNNYRIFVSIFRNI